MLKVVGLTRYHGRRAAVDDVSFSLARGEALGLLGANGAGKSTTLKLLAGLLFPSSGDVSIEGESIYQPAPGGGCSIGYAPEVPPLYEEMSVRGYLEFFARLRGLEPRRARARVRELEELLGLGARQAQVIATLSHGFRQRLGLAQALVDDPPLLILDEPTNGLDPFQIVEVRKLLLELRRKHTLIISSHALSEISKVCDRLLVLHQGKVIAEDTEANLLLRMKSRLSLVLEARGSFDRIASLSKAVPGVEDAVLLEQHEASTVVRLFIMSDVRAEVARVLIRNDVDLLRLDIDARSLEDAFLELSRRLPAEAAADA